MPTDLPLAQADENRLQQILYNLIGNAVKFTNSGTVKVSAVLTKDETLAIAVSDTGIGIPADKLESIFESFEQGDGKTAREYGGTGLGLAVTKQLVELHSGEIWVESVVGEGSRFTFTLIVSGVESTPSMTTVEVLKPNRAVALAELTTATTVHKISAPEIPESFDSRKTSSNSEQLKILVVDDEPVNLQVLSNHLAVQKVYTVQTASNGLEALEIIDNGYIPDLVLLDVMMPRMTGYEVTQKLRERFPATELPILLLTAKTQVKDLVTGLEIGANDYLTKPITKVDIVVK